MRELLYNLWASLNFHGGMLELTTYVTNLPKSGSYGYTTIFIMVCHLTKMAHFVLCHKKINAKESVDLFTSNRYRLHGVPEVFISDKDPFFWKVLAKIYGEVQHLIKCEYCSASSY